MVKYATGNRRVSVERLDLAFGALADPTRRAILSRLASGEASVSDLARPFKMSLPAVSKHLKVLQRAGLVIQGREAQWRPCRLEAKPMRDAAEWMEPYRRHWETRLDRLEDYLGESGLESATKGARRPRKGRLK